MKLNKAMLVLVAAGLLTSAASYATDNTEATSGPQEATATLVVTSTATFDHTLQAATGIVPGRLADGAVLATGTVSANQAMQKVKLSWVRSTNPVLMSRGAEYAQLLSEDGDKNKVIPVMFKSVKSEQSVSNDVNVTYTLATPAQTFSYKIVNAASEVGVGDMTISAGSYKMAVNADTVFA
ncbi:TPA: hypothetical protein H2X59_004403 [Salmonella enterica]|uniref:Fimbrial protein n=1 Tax=Salmonella enterica TaxID=28901 RepID=A0A762JAA2_SALER|nr:hypothetical protein [Salmonella enterica subsp. enterica serovar Pomona]HAF2158277.1 hypothetical protein [Salmonella enterica]HAF2414137.1 hypothetical protein [Salmonella enterica]HAF4921585.1 hypothetical protein [Salmonella enterica]HAF5916455.1 hypothetical protein [Salmonella enterica]